MVSTPSRSRQATRISLPDMVGPRWARGDGVAFFFASVVLLISFWIGTGSTAGTKKPTTGCQPWVIVETQFTFDKDLRWHRLRRRPAAEPVEHSLTLDRILIRPQIPVKPLFALQR